MYATGCDDAGDTGAARYGDRLRGLKRLDRDTYRALVTVLRSQSPWDDGFITLLGRWVGNTAERTYGGPE
jgi:hypothetical protein